MVKRQLPGLALLGVLVAIAFVANHFWDPISPLTSSVVIGFAVANVIGWPSWAEAGTALAGKRLMRTGVALMGADLSLRALLNLGVTGVLAVVIVVAVTIMGITGLARLFGLSEDLGLLMGVGYGVCGASAIAAVKPQTRASEQEASYAIGMVAICGTLSIAVLPLIGGALGLSDHLFGMWSGAAVHDVGQVIATASTRGDAALHAAIVIKLARIAMLAPVVLIMSMRHRRRAQGEPVLDGQAQAAKVPLLPGFVLGFLALAAVNSTGQLPTAVASDLATLAKVLIALGLAALGVGVRWRQLRAIGHRPLLLGLLSWVLVATVGLVAMRLVS
ncbi:MAG: YeiH family protein [Candidatus Nanopelagicales bacterium]